MRKFLTTGFLGAILGLLVGAPADASLISRSFLDQALTDYATNTALDLKADKADVTDLSDKIGTLPEGITVQGMFDGWTDSNGGIINPGLKGMYEGWTEYDNELPGLYELASDTFKFKTTFPNVSIGALLGLGLEKYTNDIYTGPIYPLWKLSEGIDKIGDAWPYISEMSPGLNNLSLNLYPPEINLENASDLVRFLFGGEIESGINQGGVLNLLGQSVVVTGAYDVDSGQRDEGFRSLSQLTDGWADSKGNIYLGVKGLNDKIGSYYWQPENGEYKFSNIPYFKELFPSTSPDKNLAAYDMANNILSNYTDPNFPGLAGVTNKLLNGWTNSNGYIINPGLKGIFGGWTVKDRYFQGLGVISDYVSTVEDAYGVRFPLVFTQGSQSTTIDGVDYTGPVYPLWKLSEGIDKIGTLPSGRFPTFPGNFLVFPGLNQPYTYPTSLAELITAIYGNSETDRHGLLGAIIAGFQVDRDGDGQFDIYAGLLPNLDLATEAKELATTANTTATAAKTAADANTAKIGTLPSGQIHMRLPDLSIFASAGITEFNYPTSLSDLFLYLFGSNEDTTKDGLFPVIGTRLGYISAQIDDIENTSNAIKSKIGTVPNGKNLAGMIGTLPDGYDSVGAALTAIKGIAEEAKAAAVAAIPDPKTEGSTGKFVLTVDIVGDNATYRWEKIDREGETTTTTE